MPKRSADATSTAGRSAWTYDEERAEVIQGAVGFATGPLPEGADRLAAPTGRQSAELRAGEAHMDVAERRLRFVELKANRLIEAAELQGDEADSLRQAVRANYAPILQQFEDNKRMARPSAS